MFPTIPIGPLRIQTFGLALLLAYMAGLWLAARRGPRHGIAGDHIYNAGFYALLVGLVAARLGHAVAYFEVYQTDPMQILSLSPGAFLALPGLLGGLAMVAIYLRRHHLSAVAFADAAAPGILLALTVAALGDFLAGRSLGSLSDAPWAMEMFGVQRQPVALIEAVALGGLLAILLLVDSRRPLRPGQLALLALFGYATIRLLTEPLRADSALVGDGWRVVQIVALAVIAFSGWLLGRGATRPDEPEAEAPPAAV
ncbi:MAG: prolipoprotein diacylglyceryl transferase [Anaerolineae bacterium]|nr:prolipoprotein diacylglyceryl transferase [Anaerolineae bacterium]MCB0244221.1 prolipoprotein diacylglyceryl transferase [Anaerolineae bacterium]MCB9129850.1 prolipoprotein diacylglyceryl transferase [Anaerolineales bacterium]MCB9140791.1 prolipoprotein diacylglyceryl transferase [Anaerolineales bacterium]MCO5242773.1 prolipoprotein diacylglyceryl transferase [Anaerolineae bacterium]